MKKSLMIIAGAFLLNFNHSQALNLNLKDSQNLSQDGTNDTLTVTFRVNGNSACESGIESTLTAKTGVLSANWNSGTKQITVKFLSASMQESDLHSYLALAGYDTLELRAKQPAYDALSADCKYARDPETE